MTEEKKKLGIFQSVYTPLPSSLGKVIRLTEESPVPRPVRYRALQSDRWRVMCTWWGGGRDRAVTIRITAQWR